MLSKYDVCFGIEQIIIKFRIRTHENAIMIPQFDASPSCDAKTAAVRGCGRQNLKFSHQFGLLIGFDVFKP